MDFAKRMPIAAAIVLAGMIFAATGSLGAQQSAHVEISVKGHRFQPSEIHAPANTPLMIAMYTAATKRRFSVGPGPGLKTK